MLLSFTSVHLTRKAILTLKHDLWWNGPKWLLEEPNNWPECKAELVKCTDKERGVCLATSHVIGSVVLFDRYSSYTKLKMAVA